MVQYAKETWPGTNKTVGNGSPAQEQGSSRNNKYYGTGATTVGEEDPWFYDHENDPWNPLRAMDPEAQRHPSLDDDDLEL